MGCGPLGANSLGDSSVTVLEDITVGDDVTVTDDLTCRDLIVTTTGTLGANAGGTFAFTGVAGADSVAGSGVNLIAGAGGTTSGAGGAMTCRAGSGTAGNSIGGSATFRGGDGFGSSAGGTTTNRGGDGGATGAGGAATFSGGSGGATSGNGAAAELRGGAATTEGNGGSALVTGRPGVTGSATARDGGNVVLTSGASVSGGVNGMVQTVGSRADVTIVTPTALAAGANDNYAPTGIGQCTTLRLTPDAGGTSTLTGIAAGSLSGRVLRIVNASTTLTLTLVHDATSTAANRFFCPNGANMVIPTYGTRTIWYDTTSSRWRVEGAVA